MKDNLIISVYTSPGCRECVMVKNYLKEKGVAFEEIDVSSDPGKALEMVQKSGCMKVPVTIMNDVVVVGFDENKMSEKISKFNMNIS